ncbi:MAG: cation transporter [Gammaproteobacteria bacterium]|nr:cation transporter [Gammaproteobacteria bacterium]MDX2458459.1 cation transporter [Gammaproteobacteria bacterium]
MAECGSCASEQASKSDLADPRFRRVLWFALVANATMFVVEIVAGMLSGSASLQADALDFFGDSVNYGITLFVLGLSNQVRSKAALFKGATMAVFGIWVIGNAGYKAVAGTVPDALIMGSVGMLALVVNAGVAVMLFRYRSGDSNMRSIWLCSRNDALGNIAVMLAASGVFVTATVWPDILVAAVIAGLNISAACHVFRQATGELRSARVEEPFAP